MRRFALLAAFGGLLAAPAFADCDDFKWDLARERALYAGDTTSQKAAADATHAPTIRPDTLYEITLLPQQQVKFILPVADQSFAFGGVVAFTVPESGTYRVGLDEVFWIDVVSDSGRVASNDAGGPQGCELPPHKLVEFELQSGMRYLLQLSGRNTNSVHLTMVKSSPAKN